MNFSDALILLKLNRKICRSNWHGKGLYVEYVESSVTEPHFRLFNSDKKYYAWVPSISDILAEDWLSRSEEVDWIDPMKN